MTILVRCGQKEICSFHPGKVIMHHFHSKNKMSCRSTFEQNQTYRRYFTSIVNESFDNFDFKGVVQMIKKGSTYQRLGGLPIPQIT